MQPRSLDGGDEAGPGESGNSGTTALADGTSLLGVVRVNIDRGFLTVGAHVLPAALRISFDRGVVEWGDVESELSNLAMSLPSSGIAVSAGSASTGHGGAQGL